MNRLLNLDSMHRVIQLYSILIGPKDYPSHMYEIMMREDGKFVSG